MRFIFDCVSELQKDLQKVGKPYCCVACVFYFTTTSICVLLYTCCSQVMLLYYNITSVDFVVVPVFDIILVFFFSL